MWLMASVYFPINNVMVAEQIPSNIRLYVYMMSRTLNCFQTITDGGAYCLTEVCSFKKSANFRKPGLAVFSILFFCIFLRIRFVHSKDVLTHLLYCIVLY